MMTRVFFTLGAVGTAQLAFAPGPAPPAAQERPLFTSHELVALTIHAPLEDIFQHRDDESEEYAGVVVVRGGAAEYDTVEVDIRTRGHSRLEERICRFPPLRLDFPKSGVAGTLFEGQDKLKLVTHCQDDREEYEQYVLLESLIYRVYNTLTPLSFRVRLARITYEDSGTNRETVTRYGFLIEHVDAVAERTGWSHIVAPLVPPDAIDPENLARVEVFQYMIGNVDCLAFQAGPDASECCHNTKPIGTSVGPVFTLPYDFDISGLMNTRYANWLFSGNLEKMGLRNVRQRRYRGLCRSAAFWPSIFTEFNERRDEIEQLFRGQEGLETDVLEETLEYIGGFYDVINDEARARREFERHCLEV
jgi:hypothetical protein